MSSSSSVPPPLPDIRRIVAGHDDAGKPAILSDGPLEAQDRHGKSTERSATVWVTSETPSLDNNRLDDGGQRSIPSEKGLGMVMPNGTNLKTVDLAPGESTSMHRTSSLDYNILIQGEVLLILDDGTERRISNPGDVVVQKGNIHAWKNPGPDWCRWIAVLVDAEPAKVDGTALKDESHKYSA